jgi:hypothetical protein
MAPPCRVFHPDYFTGLVDFWLKMDESGVFQFELNADNCMWMWVDGL